MPLFLWWWGVSMNKNPSLPLQVFHAPSQSATLQLVSGGVGGLEPSWKKILRITIFSQILLTSCSQWPLTRTLPLWCGLSSTYLLPFRAQVKHDEDQQRKLQQLQILHSYQATIAEIGRRVFLCHRPFQQLRWYRRGDPAANPLGGCFSIVHHRRILRPSADRAVPIRNRSPVPGIM